jgi:hypothetical protein
MQHARPRLKLVFSTAVVAMFVDVITKVIAVGVLTWRLLAEKPSPTPA